LISGNQLSQQKKIYLAFKQSSLVRVWMKEEEIGSSGLLFNAGESEWINKQNEDDG